MSQPFVHLRIHSEYSVSDGIVRIKPLASEAASMGMPALAITDNNNMYALVKFYNAVNAAGVKPIVGCDVWVRAESEDEAPRPLVLLAKTTQGYRNLTELLSRGYQEGQHLGKALLQRQWIEEKAEGLIALSAGSEGEIGRALLAGKQALAQDLALYWMSVFKDSFYLELHRTGRTGEEEHVHKAVDLALSIDCPVVATNDVRFQNQDEFEAHEVRVCIHDSRTLDDPRREERYSEQQYLKTPEEMCALFDDIPEAIENTIEIARRCNVTIDLGNYYLPEYPIPEGYTTESFFCEVSENGMDNRLLNILDKGADDYEARYQVYRDRLKFELDVINNMGFPGYFLIVMEFIQWAKDNDIPVGPGRGSGAGSLVAYALMITDVDPIEYDLLFERFLNPERVSLPDFDIDFCMDGRDRVIQHVMDRYGRDAVSQIITFGTLAAKAVVRDVARVQGKPYSLGDKISKLIPFDPGITLHKAMEDEPLLREFISQSEEAQEIMEMAFKLEGICRNVGKHAGGVVIAPTKITDFSPIYCDESGGLITQFDKDDVEKAGLVKFDFLGLRTLTIIDNAVKSINARKKSTNQDDINIERIPLEDPAIYQNLRDAKTTAVFQLESRGMKDLMKQVKPSRFGDVVALVALFRPGPLELAPDFIRRKSGEDEVDYLHPSLERVLDGTYGVMLYQEQVMQIAQILAGYSLADADLLRRAMGKKKPEEMAKQRDSFLKGATENGVESKQADHIFSLMEKFAGYGFNKPHSVAYALIAYQTAWLKHYYPADFMAAVLSADMQTTDKVVTNVEECREIDIDLSPPDVNRGAFRFVADTDKSIIYGLGAIKGLGEGPIDDIVENRGVAGTYSDLYELCDRIDSRKVNKKAIDGLIGSGALDELVTFEGRTDAESTIDFKRALLRVNREAAVKTAEQNARNKDGGLMDLFGDSISSGQNDKSPYSQIDTVRSLTIKERLDLEKDTLGLYLTGHPLDSYIDELRKLPTTRITDLRIGKNEQWIVGLIVNIRTMKSRKGETIAFITLDDKTGRVDLAIFADLYEINHGKLSKDSIVFCKGATSLDEFSGGIKMRATEVCDWVDAREKWAKQLKVSLTRCELDKNFAVELAGILAPFKGRPGRGCQVAIDYVRDEASVDINLGDAWRVSPDDDLIQILKDHYGNERVVLDY